MYYAETDFVIADRIGQVAKRHEIPRVQVALAWLLQKPSVTSPIVGVTKLQQLEELVGALDVRLTTEDITTLEEPYRPKRILGM
jgi:aryl-alcohol dehydrogenase-like predicted oxidoreductase